MDIKLLIEALRGGNTKNPPPAPVRYVRNSDGSVTEIKNPYSDPRRGSSTFMPKGLRGYQLHNAEAAILGEPSISYADWAKDQ